MQRKLLFWCLRRYAANKLLNGSSEAEKRSTRGSPASSQSTDVSIEAKEELPLNASSVDTFTFVLFRAKYIASVFAVALVALPEIMHRSS